jgi:hypothetical protein
MTIHCANVYNAVKYGQCTVLLLDENFAVFMSNRSTPPFVELKNCFMFQCFLICAFWMVHWRQWGHCLVPFWYIGQQSFIIRESTQRISWLRCFRHLELWRTTFFLFFPRLPMQVNLHFSSSIDSTDNSQMSAVIFWLDLCISSKKDGLTWFSKLSFIIRVPYIISLFHSRCSHYKNKNCVHQSSTQYLCHIWQICLENRL